MEVCVGAQDGIGYARIADGGIRKDCGNRVGPKGGHPVSWRSGELPEWAYFSRPAPNHG